MQSLPRVDIVLSYVNADGVMIEAAAKAGAKASSAPRPAPGGRPLPRTRHRSSLSRIRHAHVPLQSRRIRRVRVVRSPGLKRKGFIASDNLQPWKARILLSLGLSKTSDANDLQRMFDTY